MDILWFNDLRNLANTGHFSRAAELSHISQPAFSRRIKALEAWAGTNLVDRKHHPVSLTSAGTQLLEAGQQALDRLETERRLIRETQSLPERTVVTFGAQHSIGWRFYPAWLKAFEDSFGPIVSRLRADNLPNCTNDLLNGEVDFVIAYASRFARGIEPQPGLDSTLIGVDKLIPVTKPDPVGVPLFDLTGETEIQVPYLQFGADAPIGRHIEPLLTEHDLNSRLATVYENSMAGALRIRARDGAGVAWLPHTLVLPDLESGKLVTFDNPAWEVRLGIRLHRLRDNANDLTGKIWSYLSGRDPIPLTNQL